MPQFNEQSRTGAGPAQQGVSLPDILPFFFVFYMEFLDAEECWTQVVNSLSVLPGVVVPGASRQKIFVEQFMMGEMTTESVLSLLNIGIFLTGPKIEMQRGARGSPHYIEGEDN